MSDSKTYQTDFVYGSFVNHELFDGKTFNLDNGPWIAGGFVREYGIIENCRDIDVYFKNQEQAEEFVKRIDILQRYTDNLLPASNVRIDKYNLVTFLFFDSPYDVIMSIDFTCCAGVSDGKNFITHHDMFHAINEKRLSFNAHQNIKTKLNRFKKYVTYGYTPDHEVVNQVFCLDDWEDHIYGNKFVEYKNKFNS